MISYEWPRIKEKIKTVLGSQKRLISKNK